MEGELRENNKYAIKSMLQIAEPTPLSSYKRSIMHRVGGKSYKGGWVVLSLEIFNFITEAFSQSRKGVFSKREILDLLDELGGKWMSLSAKELQEKVSEDIIRLRGTIK